jgi:hypothetical protein
MKQWQPPSLTVDLTSAHLTVDVQGLLLWRLLESLSLDQILILGLILLLGLRPPFSAMWWRIAWNETKTGKRK